LQGTNMKLEKSGNDDNDDNTGNDDNGGNDGQCYRSVTGSVTVPKPEKPCIHED
jgi:hypothetical protein